jgi:phage repressor protein C with HTH and peptisase S24 domain
MELDCERYVVPVFKDAEFLIYVKGLSMQPTFRSGDIVACKKLPLDTFFQWNKVYVLDTDQGALIKRIKKSAKENFVLVVSDNDKYDPFELSLKKIYSIALVIGVIRLE